MWRLGLVAPFIAVMGIASCRQVAGITDNPPTDLTSTACGLPYGTSACASCVSASCCSESTACAGDMACRSHHECLGTCAIGDWQCRSQCHLDHPDTKSPSDAPLTACVATNCETDCGLTCGGVYVGTPPSAAPSCQACLSQMECKNEGACARSVGCNTLGQCLYGCSTPDCRAACMAASVSWLQSSDDPDLATVAPVLEAGVPGLLGAGTPLGALDPPNECAAACAIGANWSCVGKVALPTPSMNTATTMSSQVLDYVTQRPVPGVQASICRFLDPQCRSPVADGGSTENGDLFIPVPPSLAVGLASDGYVQLTAPGYIPFLYFWGYPVSLPQAPIGEPYLLILTPDDSNAAGLSIFGPDASAYSPDVPATVGFEVLDCDGQPAPGVSVAIDASSHDLLEYYSTNNLTVSSMAKSTGVSGFGGFVNVPVGVVNFTATALSTGKVVSHATALARAGAQTTVFMFPTPSTQ